MQVQAELSIASADQRSTERHATKMPAGVRRMGSKSVPVQVTDLSATGFRVALDERLPIDSVVWVRLGSLAPMMARVVWSNWQAAGCMFVAPLHPSVLDALLRES